MSHGKKYFFYKKNRKIVILLKGRQLWAVGDDTVMSGHHYQNLHRHILRELLYFGTQARQLRWTYLDSEPHQMIWLAIVGPCFFSIFSSHKLRGHGRRIVKSAFFLESLRKLDVFACFFLAFPALRTFFQVWSLTCARRLWREGCRKRDSRKFVKVEFQLDRNWNWVFLKKILRLVVTMQLGPFAAARPMTC